MKMEVVLSSPSRFGDEGTPFKSEEVREWSRVDRLTGMLERARIETGRWRTNADATAHSYGKVSDERERNSADGSVVQKAKRQVEIFQSQEPGRSVQVVRTSQWSSSRVSDSVMDSILPLETNDSLLNGINQVLSSDPWKFSALPSLSSVSKIHSDLKNDKFKFPYIESSVKNVNGNLLSKRSNSDDDLSSQIGSSDSSSKNSSTSFTRDCKNRRSLQIPNSVSIAVSSDAKKNYANKGIYSTISSATSGNTYSVSIGDESKPKSNDYGSLRFKSSPRPSRSANRSNAVTVVNIMNPESFIDDLKTRKSSIVTLRSPAEENSPTNFPADNVLKTTKQPVSKTNSSGDEGTVNLPGRAVKKVGFCKTEVHFAADSGKVNIVETDGKPPPTNKFRRRRRNNNSSGNNTQGSFSRPVEPGANNSNGKIYPRRMIIKSELSDNKMERSNADNDSSGAYCVVDLDSKKFWSSPEEREGSHKIHATMVSLGKRSDQRDDRENNELKKPKELTSPKVVSEVISRRKQDQKDYNIVTKDAENNQVLSTVVMTHEPTIARVEDTLPSLKRSLEKSAASLRKKCSLRRVASLQKSDGAEKNTKKNNIHDSSSATKDPVYVNIFKVSTNRSKSPVYENYQAPKSTEKSTSEETIEVPESLSEATGSKSTLEKKRTKTKSPDKSGKRSPGNNTSRFATWSGSLSKSARDPTKTKVVKKMPINGDVKLQRKSSPLQQESTLTKLSEDTKTGSTRFKKHQPMEVVYRTAVFNMKNEKLSPIIKKKDNKVGPRYINDLICGSKTSRLSNSKNKGHATSQNANKQTHLTTTSNWK